MQSSPSATDPLRPGRRGFAHRGLHGPSVPENSLAAFRAAAAFGCGAECDVRLSRDAVPILFHDADLQRLCGSPERVGAQASAWLSAQRLAGSAETIPTLRELLEHWPEPLPLLVEAKPEGDNAAALTHAVASEILPASRTAMVAVMSFDPRVAAELAREVPAIRRGLVVDGRWPPELRRDAVEQARAQFLAVDKLLLGDPWTAAMRRQVPVYSWTIRSPGELARVAVHADAPIWEGDGRP